MQFDEKLARTAFVAPNLDVDTLRFLQSLTVADRSNLLARNACPR